MVWTPRSAGQVSCQLSHRMVPEKALIFNAVCKLTQNTSTHVFINHCWAAMNDTESHTPTQWWQLNYWQRLAAQHEKTCHVVIIHYISTIMIPFMHFQEMHRVGQFMQLWAASICNHRHLKPQGSKAGKAKLRYHSWLNTIGLWLYSYEERVEGASVPNRHVETSAHSHNKLRGKPRPSTLCQNFDRWGPPPQREHEIIDHEIGHTPSVTKSSYVDVLRSQTPKRRWNDQMSANQGVWSGKRTNPRTLKKVVTASKGTHTSCYSKLHSWVQCSADTFYACAAVCVWSNLCYLGRLFVVLGLPVWGQKRWWL